MSQKVTIRVPKYLAEWLTHSFGNPLFLPKDSVEARLLLELLSMSPKNQTALAFDGEEQTQEEEIPQRKCRLNFVEIEILIPNSKLKTPTEWNFLSGYGQKAMYESFYDLFRKNLFTEVTDMKAPGVTRATTIYCYLERHGMDDVHWDTVTKVFHRTRNMYLKRHNLKFK